MTGTNGFDLTITRLSTHVLDTSLGHPAGGIAATLESIPLVGPPNVVGMGITDEDGRIQRLNTLDLAPGRFRLRLDTATYFADRHPAVFYPAITLDVALPGDRKHYHLAVLASTFSYSTYLGS